MPTSSHQALMLSVGAATLLNLTAVRLGSLTLHDARAPTGSASPRRVELIDVVARPAPTTAIPSVPPATASTPARANRSPARPVPPPFLPTSVPPVIPEVAGDVDGAVETRFYRSSEVQHRAEPRTDWNLDAAALDSAGVGRVVFDAYVDQDGRIIACHIREPENLAEDVRQLLELRLRETAMWPATRLGAPIASVQRIEVSFLPPGP